jgi:hypothetical protein
MSDIHPAFQAGDAGSIPVTRSRKNAQVSGTVRRFQA